MPSPGTSKTFRSREEKEEEEAQERRMRRREEEERRRERELFLSGKATPPPAMVCERERSSHEISVSNRCEQTSCFRSRQKLKPSKREAPAGGNPRLRTGQTACIIKTDDYQLVTILRQKKPSTKVRWQEMVLKLHITSPALGGNHLLDKAADSGQDEVGNFLEISLF